MPLITCPTCGKEISDEAVSCPGCGHPMKKEAIQATSKQTAPKKKKGLGCGSLLLFFIVILILASVISQCGEETKKKEQAARLEEVKKKADEKRQEAKKKADEKLQKEKKVFEQNIESHYAELKKFVDEKKYNDALTQINLFKKHKKTDYKDIEKYHKTVKTRTLAARVKKLPASDIDGNLKLYRELLALNPDKQIYKDKVVHYIQKKNRASDKKRKEEYRDSCQLEIISSGWSVDHGYAQYEGQVKNISNLKLKNVQAIVTWYDKNGGMITSSSALIEYNPILPGQTSPFKVMKTANPAMQKAGVDFSHLLGGTIKTYLKK